MPDEKEATSCEEWLDELRFYLSRRLFFEHRRCPRRRVLGFPQHMINEGRCRIRAAVRSNFQGILALHKEVRSSHVVKSAMTPFDSQKQIKSVLVISFVTVTLVLHRSAASCYNCYCRQALVCHCRKPGRHARQRAKVAKPTKSKSDEGVAPKRCAV